MIDKRLMALDIADFHLGFLEESIDVNIDE